MLTHYLSVGVLALTLTSCSGLTRRVERKEVENSKKAALVSFTLNYPMSSTLFSVGDKGTASGNFSNRESDFAERYYSGLRAALGRSTNWEMASLQAIISSDEYKNAYQQKMTGFQRNKVPLSGHSSNVPNLMDSQSIRRMTVEERNQLAQDLGVDVLVEAQMIISLETKSMAIAGFGARYPKVRIMLTSYKKGIAEPIWFEGGVDGELGSEVISSTGIFDEEDLLKKSMEPAKSAFAKLNIESNNQ